MREGELVLEVEDQSTNNYEREIGALVREVEGQSAMTYEKGVGKSNRRYLCWICGDRPFNARHQLVDHIEGAGGGGKSHLKMRKRWIEAGQPMREDWLQILENAKTEGNMGNICCSEAPSSTRNDTQADTHNDSPWPQTWDPQQQPPPPSFSVAPSSTRNDAQADTHNDSLWPQTWDPQQQPPPPSFFEPDGREVPHRPADWGYMYGDYAGNSSSDPNGDRISFWAPQWAQWQYQ